MIGLNWNARFSTKSTMAHKCHGKSKNLTAKARSSRQEQEVHGKSKNLTAKAKTLRQKQKHYGKSKKLTAKARSSRRHFKNAFRERTCKHESKSKSCISSDRNTYKSAKCNRKTRRFWCFQRSQSVSISHGRSLTCVKHKLDSGLADWKLD